MVFTIFLSCKERVSTTKRIPSDIISKEKMAMILADIHIAENMFPGSAQKDSAQIKIRTVYETVYKKYGITKKEFDKSLNYYLKNPDRLAEVYDQVTEILNTRNVEQ
jgi:hypothetical protein